LTRRRNRQLQFRSPTTVSRIIVRRPQLNGDLFPARVIVGWLHPQFDSYYLAGSHRQAPGRDLLQENEKLLHRGRLTRLRLPVVDLRDAVGQLPGNYMPYVARFLGDPIVRQKLTQGFELVLVDLHRICGLQTVISLMKTESMTKALDLSDPLSIARLALPMTLTPDLIVPSLSTYAPSMQVAKVSVPGTTQPPSHLHVARLNDRYLMTDGYHRAYVFLRAGIRYVPGFYKVAHRYRDLDLPDGLLPQSLLARDRPPLLTDFLVDDVAVDLH